MSEEAREWMSIGFHRSRALIKKKEAWVEMSSHCRNNVDSPMSQEDLEGFSIDCLNNIASSKKEEVWEGTSIGYINNTIRSHHRE